ncbi:MAG: hypothetical protein AB202_00725 [Parcubacteria bacterium C7867-007]|nr:MAG: hypothetical protein AB202_00725 [Parcubacteria bacterium C7867-007]
MRKPYKRPANKYPVSILLLIPDATTPVGKPTC